MTLSDWERYAEALGAEHKVILRSTLPTESFSFLLEGCIRDCKSRLIEIDLSRDAIDFKQRYHSIKLQQDLAESLLAFVKSLSTTQQQ
jgi:hypothetical protein